MSKTLWEIAHDEYERWQLDRADNRDCIEVMADFATSVTADQTAQIELLTSSVKELEAERDRLREALEFYANEKNWTNIPKSLALVIIKNAKGLGFQKAKEALNPVQEKTEDGEGE